MLRLHTMQSREAYDRLAYEGILRGDMAYAEPDFREAYDWMARQMDARLPTFGSGILWFWARTDHSDLVEQARYARHQVLLEVRLPSERVLLSHFDDWHAVLGRSLHLPFRPGESYDQWLARSGSALDDWDERSRRYRLLPLTQWPAALRAELESSWEAIFAPQSVAEAPYLQATAHEFRADDVVSAVRIG